MRQATMYVPYAYGSQQIMTTVEASVQRGLPEFRIVGLPDRSLREAAVRVKSAIQNSGFKFPLGRIVVNIGPADIPKSGTYFDIAIALALLAAEHKVAAGVTAYGELSLNGAIGKTTLLHMQNTNWIANAVNPVGTGKVVHTLSEAWNALTTRTWESYAYSDPLAEQRSAYSVDAIRGNESAKRALLIALVGRHHLLLSGPPGCGKTMLAESARELGVLGYADEQALTVLEQQSPTGRKAGEVPYQAPHHTVNRRALLGSAKPLLPGVMSLCTGGVLFLDELPHMQPEVLHSLREPLESRMITLGEAEYAKLPANPVVIAAKNLCPCGKRGKEGDLCMCSPRQLHQYERKLGEALLDRFHLHVEMSYQDTEPEALGETYRETIARLSQQKMTVAWSPDATALCDLASKKLAVSFRTQQHIRQVSETIAKIEGSQTVQDTHVKEAMQYRVRKV